MKILIVSATYKEISPLFEEQSLTKNVSKHYYSTRFLSNHIDVLITGVGMVATSFYLTKTLSINTYDRIINVGIAGAFNKSFVMGSVYEVVKDQFSEIGAENGSEFLSHLDIGFSEFNEFPFESGFLLNRDSFISSIFPKANSITVNRVHGCKEEITKVKLQFSPELETMEGAAFFYVCKMLSVPCVQLRSVSNFIEERNKTAWNIPLAVDSLNKALINTLTNV
tara:strand:+ start:1155 stop:1826 length:672 start_codon:yes stop_codon:yes gene_type:complete